MVRLWGGYGDVVKVWAGGRRGNGPIQPITQEIWRTGDWLSSAAAIVGYTINPGYAWGLRRSTTGESSSARAGRSRGKCGWIQRKLLSCNRLRNQDLLFCRK